MSSPSLSDKHKPRGELVANQIESDAKACKMPGWKTFFQAFIHNLLACVAGGIRGHKGGSLKYRLPKN